MRASHKVGLRHPPEMCERRSSMRVPCSTIDTNESETPAMSASCTWVMPRQRRSVAEPRADRDLVHGCDTSSVSASSRVEDKRPDARRETCVVAPPQGRGEAKGGLTRERTGKAEISACRSSNQVTVRPPLLRQPHRAASAATSRSPRSPSASPSARRSFGAPGPLRSATSTRTMPPLAVTVTVAVPSGAPDPLCRTLLLKSSLTSKTAASSQGCPEPSTSPTNRRASRARPPARQA
jgi:hypothetical protein